jgi:hypothetical protein
MWWTIFVRNGGKAHIDQLLLTNLNYEWQGNSERRVSACKLFSRDALGRMNYAEQPSQVFTFLPSLPISYLSAVTPIAGKFCGAAK